MNRVELRVRLSAELDDGTRRELSESIQRFLAGNGVEPTEMTCREGSTELWITWCIVGGGALGLAFVTAVGRRMGEWIVERWSEWWKKQTPTAGEDQSRFDLVPGADQHPLVPVSQRFPVQAPMTQMEIEKVERFDGLLRKDVSELIPIREALKGCRELVVVTKAVGVRDDGSEFEVLSLRQYVARQDVGVELVKSNDSFESFRAR